MARRPGNPRPAIDPAQTRKITDLTAVAFERCNQAMVDVVQLLDSEEEILSVGANVIITLAMKLAIYARDNTNVPEDHLLRVLGLHIAQLTAKDDYNDFTSKI